MNAQQHQRFKGLIRGIPSAEARSIDETIRQVKQALEIAQRAGDKAAIAEATEILGMILLIDKPGNALRWFRKLLRLVPDHRDGHWGMGMSLVYLGRVLEAKPALLEAASLGHTEAAKVLKELGS